MTTLNIVGQYEALKQYLKNINRYLEMAVLIFIDLDVALMAMAL